MLSGLLNCTRCSKAIGWAQQLTFRTPKLICCWQASYRLCIRHCRTRTCVLTRFQSLITLLTEAIRGRKAGQDRAPATHPIIQARRGNPALHKEISNRVLHLNSRFLNRRPEWDASACEPERTQEMSGSNMNTIASVTNAATATQTSSGSSQTSNSNTEGLSGGLSAESFLNLLTVQM